MQFFIERRRVGFRKAFGVDVGYCVYRSVHSYISKPCWATRMCFWPVVFDQWEADPYEHTSSHHIHTTLLSHSAKAKKHYIPIFLCTKRDFCNDWSIRCAAIEMYLIQLNIIQRSVYIFVIGLSQRHWLSGSIRSEHLFWHINHHFKKQHWSFF